MIRKQTRMGGFIFALAAIGGVLVPHLFDWQLILLAALGLAYLITRSMRNHYERLRQIRVRLGYCGKCSYDVRGIASDRCPECGEPIPVETPRTPRTPPHGATQHG